MFASLFRNDEKKYRQTVCTIVNYIPTKSYWVENRSGNGRQKDNEKLLQTKGVPQKLVNLVHLKVYSEQTKHQKCL